MPEPGVCGLGGADTLVIVRPFGWIESLAIAPLLRSCPPAGSELKQVHGCHQPGSAIWPPLIQFLPVVCQHVTSPAEVSRIPSSGLGVSAPHGEVRASAKALASTLLLSSGVCCDRWPRAALPLLSNDVTTS